MAHLPQRVVAPHIGFGLFAKAQGLWSIDWGSRWCLPINQAMQDIENMGFGSDPVLECDFNSAQDSLFVMVQDKGQDFDHFVVTPKPLEQLCLQLAEGLWHFQEGGTIAQGAWLALNEAPRVFRRQFSFGYAAISRFSRAA
jgi:hypothetical protein